MYVMGVSGREMLQMKQTSGLKQKFEQLMLTSEFFEVVTTPFFLPQTHMASMERASGVGVKT